MNGQRLEQVRIIGGDSRSAFSRSENGQNRADSLRQRRLE